MTPYENGKDVILDPTIAAKDFFFGTVPDRLIPGEGKEMVIGKITDRKYLHNERVQCNTYGVRFPGEKKDLWFLEKEIV